MDSKTKQDLLTISLPMKKGCGLKDAKVVAEREYKECRQGKEPNAEHIRPRQELLPLEQAVKHQAPPKNANEGIVAGIEKYLASDLLADGNNHVYMASDKKRDEEGTEYWQLINGWSETVALLPLGRLRVISDEECTRLLLQQELVISDGVGNSEDMIWSPSEKKLSPIAAKGD